MLPGLLSGETIATWCWAEPPPNDRLAQVTVTASATDDGYVLNGRKGPVEAGGKPITSSSSPTATKVRCSCWCRPTTEGVTVVAADGLDLTRRYAEIHFDDVRVSRSSLVGDASTAAGDVERQLQLANVMQLHEMVGSMERAFEITMEWLFNRYSFGRPLASYQALKHRSADMKAWIEIGHGIADAATRQVQDDGDRAGEYTSVAKAYLGVYGAEVLQDCVQMHGGIGVTFDHDMHLYLRRVVVDSLLYGTVSDHRQRLTTMLEDKEDARA